MTALCPSCARLDAGWANYPGAQPGIRIASGAAYDDTLAGVRDRTAGRRADRDRLIADQRAAIAAACGRGTQPGCTGRKD